MKSMEMCIRDRHTTPQRALAGMLAKHIVSLYDMCFAEETVYPMDTWDEKITDSLNYLFLLKAIVKEGHTCLLYTSSRRKKPAASARSCLSLLPYLRSAESVTM